MRKKQIRPMIARIEQRNMPPCGTQSGGENAFSVSLMFKESEILIMLTKNVRVGLKRGLEARPAAMLVQIANGYESTIHVGNDKRRMKVNAKSIMGVMSLSMISGETLTVMAEGKDEEEAVEEIEKFLCGETAIKSLKERQKSA